MPSARAGLQLAGLHVSMLGHRPYPSRPPFIAPGILCCAPRTQGITETRACLPGPCSRVAASSLGMTVIPRLLVVPSLKLRRPLIIKPQAADATPKPESHGAKTVFPSHLNQRSGRWQGPAGLPSKPVRAITQKSKWISRQRKRSRFRSDWCHWAARVVGSAIIGERRCWAAVVVLCTTVGPLGVVPSVHTASAEARECSRVKS